MEKTEEGYCQVTVNGVKPETQYMYQFAAETCKPDPASHFQPDGVFGSSAVVNHDDYKWRDAAWRGIPFKDLVMYELHVGTFTAEGTFEAAKARVQELAELGVNALELMPVAQFSGARNWGYDGVFPYAVENTYGGPEGLKRLVDHCHVNGVAVLLDVVYNHVGPEGNCLSDFGPYFLETRRTPWGLGINFDGAESSHVRRFFLQNALYWFRNYHIDGLRLDAVHAIEDPSPKHFLKELAEAVAAYSAEARKVYLVAESNLNDPKLVRLQKSGGFGLDAVWLDDFHHALHALVTGERSGYYMDFGKPSQLLKAFNEGFVYTGEFSEFWRSNRGQSSKGIKPEKFVVFSQNHDQIGNRMLGERFVTLAGLEAAKLAAGIVALSPYVPLFFMGEEYAEQAPFLFFTDFADSALRRNVTKGRRKEFAAFNQPREIADPEHLKTFTDSKISWQRRWAGEGKKILGYYGELLRLRRLIRSKDVSRPKIGASEEGKLMFLHFPRDKPAVAVVANLDSERAQFLFPFKGGEFRKELDSSDDKWAGPGSSLPDRAKFGEAQVAQPYGCAVYVKPLSVKNLD